MSKNLKPKGESKKSKEQRARELLSKEKENLVAHSDFERKDRGNNDIWYDRFRLDVEIAEKNISWSQNAQWEPMPHKHFYHSTDSDGRTYEYATPALGHTHKIEVVGKDENGEPIVKVGPPVVISKGKAVPVNPDKMKDHTHEVSYVYSEKIKKRQYSDEYLKVKTKLEQFEHKGATPPSGATS